MYQTKLMETQERNIIHKKIEPVKMKFCVSKMNSVMATKKYLKLSYFSNGHTSQESTDHERNQLYNKPIPSKIPLRKRVRTTNVSEYVWCEKEKLRPLDVEILLAIFQIR